MIKLLEEKAALLESKAKSEATCEEDLTQLHSSADNNDISNEPVQGNSFPFTVFW